MDLDHVIPRAVAPAVWRTLTIARWATASAFVALMTASGVAFLLGLTPIATMLRHLGYPPYFHLLLGVAKLLGVAALVAPGLLVVREWAYAGFTFLLLAAVASHLAAGDPPARATPAALLLVLLLVLRTLGRRVESARLVRGTP